MTTITQRVKRVSGARMQEILAGLLFASPFMIGVLAFWVGPMLYSLFLITQDWNMLSPPEFVGFENITRMLEDPLVGQALGNTAYYTFIGVPLQLLLALILAIALNQKLYGRALFRAIFYLPAITPAVASAVVWRQIFNFEYGVLNNFLGTLGIEGQKWLFDPQLAKPAFIMMSMWGVGPQMVIFLAGLQSVPVELLEAASIDGANAWRRFWKVSIPMISPVLFFNLIMGIIGSFQVFTASFIMTAGGPQNATLFMVLKIYYEGFRDFRMGYAATLAWVLFAIIMFFTVLQFRLGQQWVYYEGKV
jgi:multiple sugar transport system permease protein